MGLYIVFLCVSYIIVYLFEIVGVCVLYFFFMWKIIRILIGGFVCKISNNCGCGKRIRGKLIYWRINLWSG